MAVARAVALHLSAKGVLEFAALLEPPREEVARTPTVLHHHDPTAAGPQSSPCYGARGLGRWPFARGWPVGRGSVWGWPARRWPAGAKLRGKARAPGAGADSCRTRRDARGVGDVARVRAAVNHHGWGRLASQQAPGRRRRHRRYCHRCCYCRRCHRCRRRCRCCGRRGCDAGGEPSLKVVARHVGVAQKVNLRTGGCQCIAQRLKGVNGIARKGNE